MPESPPNTGPPITQGWARWSNLLFYKNLNNYDKSVPMLLSPRETQT